MEPPDPDPLHDFLVSAAPNPTRSATPPASHIHQVSDPQPPTPDLRADGSLSAECQGDTEIDAVRGGAQKSNGGGSSPEISTLPPSKPQDLTALPALLADGSVSAERRGDTKIEAVRKGIEGGAQKSNGGGNSPENSTHPPPKPQDTTAHQATSAQSNAQPGSPTSIDPSLQDMARALFPDLAEDLKRLKKQACPGQMDAVETAINSAAPAPSTATRDSMEKTPGEDEIMEAILRSRIPESQKGKQTLEGGNGEEHQMDRHQERQAYKPGAAATREKETAAINTTPSSTSISHHLISPVYEEGSETAKTASKRRGAEQEIKTIQASQQISGADFFKSKMEGKCFNCFSPNHIARDCGAPHRCWKCYRKGHRAADCLKTVLQSQLQNQRPASQSKEHKHKNSHHSSQPRSSADHRSFAEVVRGTTAMAARYPGDPRGRPARAFCSITATGPIRRRRDDIVHRVAVCWLNGNSHGTEPYHLGEALRHKLHLRHDDFQIVKHYPEKFLVIFKQAADRQRLLDRGALISRGRDYRFAPWSERHNAANITWEFRVKVRIEGVLVHCWAEEVAALALGKSCAIHYLEEKTRRRERMRTFDLWAWCRDPTDIPKEVTLTVTEPDREPPPISIRLLQALPQYDAPNDLKHAHVYNLRNHLDVVEDLSFLRDNGRGDGPGNRKPRRNLLWDYGVPDSLGEDLQGRREEDRVGDIGRYQRRDDDDYNDQSRGRYSSYRRHRSVSSWARNARCRTGTEDYISSNRWRQGRSSPPRRNRVTPASPTLVWQKKAVQEGTKKGVLKGKKMKRVTFADPIATELKPPKMVIQDDSIELIMGTETIVTVEPGTGTHLAMQGEVMEDINDMATIQPTQSETNDSEKDLEGHMIEMQTQPAENDLEAQIIGMEAAPAEETDLNNGVQQALEETIKIMHQHLATSTNTSHFQKPVNKGKMDAIQTLIEEERKLQQKCGGGKKMKVGLEA